jgi:hypothetical protein
LTPFRLYDLFVKDYVDRIKGDVGSCFWAFAGVVTAGYGKAAQAAAKALRAGSKLRKGGGTLRRSIDYIGPDGKLFKTMANVLAVAEKYGIDLKE